MIPFKFVTYLVFKTVDAGIGLALAIDEWLGERKRRRGLSFKDAQRINQIANAAGHERQSAKTVIIPGRRGNPNP